jgi:hypothetical protein
MSRTPNGALESSLTAFAPVIETDPNETDASKQRTFSSTAAHRGTLEFPLGLDTKHGLHDAGQPRLFVSSNIPLNKRLTVTLDNRAMVKGQVGSLSCKAGVHVNVAKTHALSASTQIHDNEYLQSVTIGHLYSTKTASFQTSLKSPLSAENYVLTTPGTWKPTLNVSKTLGDDLLTVKAHCSLRSINNLLSTAATSTNWSELFHTNNIVHYGAGIYAHVRHAWSLAVLHTGNGRGESPLALSATVTPQLSAGRAVRLSASYGGIQFQAAGVQFVWNGTTTSQQVLKKLSVGLGSFSSGFQAVVSLTTRGNFSLVVPIAIATSVVDPVAYPLHLLYMSALGWLVQEMAVRVLCSTPNDVVAAEKQATATADRLNTQRHDASNQQELMQFQAKRRKNAEKTVNGLIITAAVYYTTTTTFNVTVPLQYWVMDSRLELAATSKSKLIGFYDIAGAAAAVTTNETASRCWWIAGFWSKEARDNDNHANNNRTRMPKLSVEYKYRGKAYRITIADNEKLSLPSSRAKQAPLTPGTSLVSPSAE